MENVHSCCFVARINTIKAIEGADNIELATIGGWSCVVPKDGYEVDDLVIIATTDAIIPKDLSDVMGVTGYLRKGQRVRTVRLRGVYSECLIIPMSYASSYVYKREGDDRMENLGITKYEPPARQVQLGGGRTVRYQDNPNFPIYTKFPNLKNVPNMFTEQDDVVITRKIHGTNARYGIVRKVKLTLVDRIKRYLGTKLRLGGDAWKWIEYEFTYGSHNMQKGSDTQGYYSTDVWHEVAVKYDIKKKLWGYVTSIFEPGDALLQDGVVIYGEIYGAGIQKNYDYGLTNIQFKVFDILEGTEYLNPRAMYFSMDLALDLPRVEVLHNGAWSQEIQDKLVFDQFIPGTKIPEEGIVIKSAAGGTTWKVAKVINPAYLIYAENKSVGDSH